MVFVAALIIQIILLYFLSRRVSREVYYFLFRLTKNRKSATYLFAIFFLPGTFLHEVAHFLMALVLLVPVGQLELTPEIQGDEKLKMGSVPIAKTDIFRRTLIGVAPIVLGSILIFSSLYWATSRDLLSSTPVVLGIAYLVFQVGNTMFSSKKDLEGAWILPILFVAVYLALYLLGVRISLDTSSTFVTQSVEIVKKANLFLLVPIVIDLAILFLLNLTKKAS